MTLRITQDEVEQAIAIVRREAAALGKALSVAVVDAGGYLVAVERQEQARPLTPSIALSKAYSAAVMQRPTRLLKGWSDHDPVFFSQVAQMGWQPIVATLGGATLKRDGQFVGGVGISGGTAEEDEAVSQAIVDELGFDTEFAAWGGQAAGGAGKH